MTWFDPVWFGLVQFGLGLVRSGPICSCLMWFESVWFSLVQFGPVCSGLVGSDLVLSGLVQFGLVRSALVWSDLVSSGLIRFSSEYNPNKVSYTQGNHYWLTQILENSKISLCRFHKNSVSKLLHEKKGVTL